MQNVISVHEAFNDNNTLRGHTINVDGTELIRVGNENPLPVETYVQVLGFLKAHDAFEGVTLALDTIREGKVLSNVEGLLVNSAWGARPELEVTLARFPEHPELFEIFVLDDDGMPYDSEIDTDSMFRILMTWASAPENASFDLVEELENLW